MCNQFEPLLDVQGLEVHFGDSVIVKDRILFDLVLVEDCEHFAQGRLLLVRAWPMPSCSTKNLHLLGTCNGKVGHVRFCVVIVTCQIHCWSKPCSARIHVGVGVGHVGLITCRCGVERHTARHSSQARAQWELSQFTEEIPTRVWRRSGRDGGSCGPSHTGTASQRLMT